MERSCEDGTEASLCLKAMYMFYIRQRKYSVTELVSTWYLGVKRNNFHTERLQLVISLPFHVVW